MRAFGVYISDYWKHADDVMSVTRFGMSEMFEQVHIHRCDDLNSLLSRSTRRCYLCGCIDTECGLYNTQPALAQYCRDCKVIGNRMFEYFENKHPLLEKLTKIEYLNTNKRDDEIKVQCNILKKQIAYCNWLIQFAGNLHYDVTRLIVKNHFDIICSEKRVGTKDFQ